MLLWEEEILQGPARLGQIIFESNQTFGSCANGDLASSKNITQGNLRLCHGHSDIWSFQLYGQFLVVPDFPILKLFGYMVTFIGNTSLKTDGINAHI